MSQDIKPTAVVYQPCRYCHPRPCCGVHDWDDDLRLLEQQSAFEAAREELRKQVDEETRVLLAPCPPSDLLPAELLEVPHG